MGPAQKPPTSSGGVLQGLFVLDFLPGDVVGVLSTTDVTNDGAGTGEGEIERLSWGGRGRESLVGW